MWMQTLSKHYEPINSFVAKLILLLWMRVSLNMMVTVRDSVNVLLSYDHGRHH